MLQGYNVQHRDQSHQFGIQLLETVTHYGCIPEPCKILYINKPQYKKTNKQKKARRESNTLGENEMIHQLDYLTTHSFIYLNIC